MLNFLLLSIPLLMILEDKNTIEAALPIFIVGDLAAAICCYLLFSSISINILINDTEFIVKGQPIRYKNRIQHSFIMKLNEISKVYIKFDEYNSKGEQFSSLLAPTHIYQEFIYFEMQDGKINKLWLKHFSIKQKKEILNIKK